VQVESSITLRLQKLLISERSRAQMSNLEVNSKFYGATMLKNGQSCRKNQF
jgi:hypothetical protein